MGMLSIFQAIDIAIESVEKRIDITPAKKREVLYLLNQVKKKDCYTQWNKDSIIEYLQKWRDEHGRPPTTTNLREVGMPHAATIQRYFDMSPSALLKQLFPELIPFHRVVVNEWGFTTEQEWLDCFKEQFNKHLCENMSSKKYDVVRDKDTPTWGTIARHCDIVGWQELMKRAGVTYLNKNKIKTAKANELKLNMRSPFLEKVNELNKERDRHLKELYEVAVQIKA